MAERQGLLQEAAPGDLPPAVARLQTDIERATLLTDEVLLVVRRHLAENGLVGSVVLDSTTDLMDLMEIGMDSSYLAEVSVRLEALTGCAQRGAAFVRPNLPVTELVQLALQRFHDHQALAPQGEPAEPPMQTDAGLAGVQVVGEQCGQEGGVSGKDGLWSLCCGLCDPGGYVPIR